MKRLAIAVLLLAAACGASPPAAPVAQVSSNPIPAPSPGGKGGGQPASDSRGPAPIPIPTSTPTGPSCVGACPVGRGSGMMARDAALKEMVLFSGAVPGVGFMYDTWTWDGSSWTAATGAVAGQTPPSRTFGTFFYDPISKSMILFGGRSQTDTMLSDTWSWNGGWTRLNPVHGPSPRSLASAVYDPALNETIMVGGWAGNQTFLQDTWAWTGSDWSILPISQGPPGSFGTVLGYRPSDHDLELTALGGGPVYLFDGKAWTVDTAGGSGGGCLYGTGAQDSVHSTLVVFGYCGTWIWDGTKWSSLSSADLQPPLRGDEGGSPMMAYAPGIGVVLFSGRLGDQTLPNDLWVWNGNHWTQKQ